MILHKPQDVALHTPDTLYSPRHLPSWFLLAGAAGVVNGVAFLMCEQYVTHVTGTVTRVGLEWLHLGIAVEYAAVLLCFILGAFSSVIALQARARRGKRPHWATPLVFVALMLGSIAIAGQSGVFGPFGGRHIADAPPFVLLSLLAFAMGLQNASVSTTTGLAVRTTHMTGPSSDLGVHLGTAMLSSGAERRAALRGAALRGGKALSFILGASLALPLGKAFGFLALLAPVAFILAAASLSFVPDWGPSDFPSWARKDGATPRGANLAAPASAAGVRGGEKTLVGSQAL